MASILQFFNATTVFDDQTARILGEAFDAACTDMPDMGQPDVVREIVARRIIDAAIKGERDPIRLHVIGASALARIKT
jgi:hypothetical protein